MVFYHAFYMLGYFFDFEFMREAQVFFEPLQPPFACLFILISGISSNLSHSNLARGLKLALISIGFTAVTVFLLPLFDIHDAKIIFGILHLLSVSMLLYSLVQRLFEKIPAAVGFAVFLVLFFVCYSIPNGSILGFDLPKALYANDFSAVFGFPHSDFYSADYFPLLPFVFMFFAGTFLGRYARSDSLPDSLYRLHCKPLAAVGRKTLIIYILHWPIIFLLGLIISIF